MILAAAEPGSFRDPSGRIFLHGDRVLRAVMPAGAPSYAAAKAAGIYARLADSGHMLSLSEVEAGLIDGGLDAAYVLEHPRLPFVSYPYEWCFSLHRAAALRQLDTHLEALKSGFTLSDATAYNIQFQGTRPVFIDHLSVRPYRDGEYWLGHRQFCQQFLNPLLFWALLGVAPNAWFRGSLEGIAPEEIAPLLKLRHKTSWTVLTHVVMQAALHNRSVSGGDGGAPAGKPQQKLPLNGLVALLSGLRDYIGGLKLKTETTVWSSYAGQNSYGGEEAAAKRAFVGEAVEAARPGLMFDIGCNTGDYSAVALDAGAKYVVGFDYDYGALEQAYRRFDAQGAPFLPLWLDAANPSPSQGWGQKERKGLAERGRADFLIALAFIHHIVIGRNVPMGMALDWLIGMAPAGVIEFPPKEDRMVQVLLSTREDIFPDYGVDQFMAELKRRACVVRVQALAGNGRLLVEYGPLSGEQADQQG